MQWLNEPASWQRTGDVLRVSVDPGTDFWRTTGYGYVHDNGHIYGEQLPGDLDVSVRVRGAFANQYDQAGIMLRADEQTWLKTGLEYFEGRPRLSTVHTMGCSSWMVADLPPGTDEVALRVARRGDAVEVRYTAGEGAAELAALVFMPPGREMLAGIVCAAPEGAGFSVAFHDLRIVGREWAGPETANDAVWAAGAVPAAGWAQDEPAPAGAGWNGGSEGWRGERADDGAPGWAGDRPGEAPRGWAADGPDEPAPGWTRDGPAPGWAGDRPDEPAPSWAGDRPGQAPPGWAGDRPDEAAPGRTRGKPGEEVPGWIRDRPGEAAPGRTGKEPGAAVSGWAGREPGVLASGWAGKNADDPPPGWAEGKPGDKMSGCAGETAAGAAAGGSGEPAENGLVDWAKPQASEPAEDWDRLSLSVSGTGSWNAFEAATPAKQEQKPEAAAEDKAAEPATDQPAGRDGGDGEPPDSPDSPAGGKAEPALTAAGQPRAAAKPSGRNGRGRNKAKGSTSAPSARSAASDAADEWISLLTADSAEESSAPEANPPRERTRPPRSDQGARLSGPRLSRPGRPGPGVVPPRGDRGQDEQPGWPGPGRGQSVTR
jgi:regulation of enolase protein 1 (concanavalin A-like superfamily)